MDLAKITWEDVSKCPYDKFDYDYHLEETYQPSYEMHTLIGVSVIPDGKPYRRMLFYKVINNQMLIYAVKFGPGVKDFDFSQVVDLQTLDLVTEPAFRMKQKGFLFVQQQAVFCGERYFLRAQNPGEVPYTSSFLLRFPEDQCEYRTRDAVKFSSFLKRRIASLRSKGN